jgi:hypothetical protein
MLKRTETPKYKTHTATGVEAAIANARKYLSWVFKASRRQHGRPLISDSRNRGLHELTEAELLTKAQQGDEFAYLELRQRASMRLFPW